MKIRCIENKVSSLPQKIIDGYSISYPEFSLIVGKEYVVYALTEFYDYIWYCVHDEHCTYYPMWNPGPLFDLVDNRLSRYWVFSIKENLKKDRFFCGFKEWANEVYFYDQLTEEEPREKELFRNYKELMDLEFPDNTVSEVAQIGDQEWLLCPFCIDAWQSSTKKDAMVRCPKCRKLLHNPRYEFELNSYPR